MPGDRDRGRRTARASSIVVGAPGTPEYAASSASWADHWQAAAAKAGGRVDRDRPERRRPAATDRDGCARSWPSRPRPAGEPLWIVLIGHGTYDGREAKFNLRGPDVTDVELAEWLEPDQAAGRGDRLRLGERPVPQPALGRRTGSSSRRPGAATS